ANAFAVAAVLTRRWRRSAIPAWLAALTVAYSRLYLDRHWFSDVAFALPLGVGGAVLAAWVIGRRRPATVARRAAWARAFVGAIKPRRAPPRTRAGRRIPRRRAAHLLPSRTSRGRMDVHGDRRYLPTHRHPARPPRTAAPAPRLRAASIGPVRAR